MIVYGIKNCDTIKKTLQWLKSNDIDFEFHDYKKEGISEVKLKSWCKQVGWEKLLNKKGTTWRQLDEKTQASVKEETQAIEVMRANTSLIKRPVVESDGKIVAIGFNEAELKANLF